jgi:nucleoside 2-deoxyribosyltransferase
MSHPKRSVYLGGPITGHDHDGARHGWREEAEVLRHKMGLEHISFFSPMRGKEFLKHHGILTSGVGYPEHPMSRREGITTRDVNDMKFCDAMLACYLETPTHRKYDDVELGSLGTAFEHGACYILQKPIVMVAKPGNIHADHCMLTHSAGYLVETLEEGIELIGFLLTPGI